MIPIFRPCYGEEEIEAVAKVLRSGWVGLGPKTEAFEHVFAQYVGVKHAVATNSGTAALHLALKMLDLEDAEVITTPMTFVSTNHAILYNGGIPHFVDIEWDTLNIDATKIEAAISSKTKAIVVVHYGGHACEMDTILCIARRHGLKVVEDVAHGCGGTYRAKKLGSLADLGCFSFHAVKNLACGEGGMITTDGDGIAKRLRKLRWMGISKDTWSRDRNLRYSWFYEVEEVGFKYHMHDISAAIGLIQLKKLDQMNARRRQLVERYNRGLEAVPWLERPVEKPYTRSALHNYVIKAEQRDALNAFLKDREISTGVHYYPNNLYTMYRCYAGPTPVAHSVWKQLLTLPLFPDLTDQQQDRIIEAIRSFRPDTMD